MSDTAPRTMWLGGILVDLDRLEQLAASVWEPRVAAALFERMRVTEAIVRELADRPGYNPMMGDCAWCHEGTHTARLEVDMWNKDNHAEFCPWRRAVEATKP